MIDEIQDVREMRIDYITMSIYDLELLKDITNNHDRVKKIVRIENELQEMLDETTCELFEEWREGDE